ncbi:helix-turn-helix domain-containing protein [Nocardia anaemiae]|uniref:helix-turn-helix domain-containing protein n=1 Tax=Nocardia anaemiae TaxID=263910 RepID=UPI000B335AE5|nr:helix-turn-helix domain-containing protein [Nocardia anaemiae]
MDGSLSLNPVVELRNSFESLPAVVRRPIEMVVFGGELPRADISGMRRMAAEFRAQAAALSDRSEDTKELLAHEDSVGILGERLRETLGLHRDGAARLGDDALALADQVQAAANDAEKTLCVMFVFGIELAWRIFGVLSAAAAAGPAGEVAAVPVAESMLIEGRGTVAVMRAGLDQAFRTGATRTAARLSALGPLQLPVTLAKAAALPVSVDAGVQALQAASGDRTLAVIGSNGENPTGIDLTSIKVAALAGAGGAVGGMVAGRFAPKMIPRIEGSRLALGLVHGTAGAVAGLGAAALVTGWPDHFDHVLAPLLNGGFAGVVHAHALARPGSGAPTGAMIDGGGAFTRPDRPAAVRGEDTAALPPVEVSAESKQAWEAAKAAWASTPDPVAAAGTRPEVPAAGVRENTAPVKSGESRPPAASSSMPHNAATGRPQVGVDSAAGSAARSETGPQRGEPVAHTNATAPRPIRAGAETSAPQKVSTRQVGTGPETPAAAEHRSSANHEQGNTGKDETRHQTPVDARPATGTGDAETPAAGEHRLPGNEEHALTAERSVLADATGDEVSAAPAADPVDSAGSPAPSARDHAVELLADFHASSGDQVPEQLRLCNLPDEVLRAGLFDTDARKSMIATTEIIRRGTISDAVPGGMVLRVEQAEGLHALDRRPVEMKPGEGKSLMFMAAAMQRAVRHGDCLLVTTTDGLAHREFTRYRQLLADFGIDVFRADQQRGFGPVTDGRPAVVVATGETVGHLCNAGHRPPRHALIDEMDGIIDRGERQFLRSEGVERAAPEATAREVFAAHDFLAEALAKGTLSHEDFGLTRIIEEVGEYPDGTPEHEFWYDGRAELTPGGREKVEALPGGKQWLAGMGLSRLEMAAAAEFTCRKSTHYVMDAGKIVIIDQGEHGLQRNPTTSSESRWSAEQGKASLAQAVEAKEIRAAEAINMSAEQHQIVVRADADSAKTINAVEIYRTGGRPQDRFFDEVTGASGTLADLNPVLEKIYGLEEAHRVDRAKEQRLMEGAPEVVANTRAKLSAIAEGAHRVWQGGRGRSQEILCHRNDLVDRQVQALVRKGVPREAIEAVDADRIAGWGAEWEGQLQKVFDAAGEQGKILVINRQGQRGVDIAVSEAVQAKGGMFVWMTEVPEQSYIHEQAKNRTARNGDRGAAQALMSPQDALIRKAMHLHGVREAAVRYDQAAAAHRSDPTPEKHHNLVEASHDLGSLVPELQQRALRHATADFIRHHAYLTENPAAVLAAAEAFRYQGSTDVGQPDYSPGPAARLAGVLGIPAAAIAALEQDGAADPLGGLLERTGLPPAAVEALRQHVEATARGTVEQYAGLTDEQALDQLVPQRDRLAEKLGWDTEAIEGAEGMRTIDPALTEARNNLAKTLGYPASDITPAIARDILGEAVDHHLSAEATTESATSDDAARDDAARDDAARDDAARDDAARDDAASISANPVSADRVAENPVAQDVIAAASHYLATAALLDLVMRIHRRSPNSCVNNAVTGMRVLSGRDIEMPSRTLAGHGRDAVANVFGAPLENAGSLDGVAESLRARPGGITVLVYKWKGTPATGSPNATGIADDHMVLVVNDSEPGEAPKLVVVDLAASRDGDIGTDYGPKDLRNRRTLLAKAVPFDTWRQEQQKFIGKLPADKRRFETIEFDVDGNLVGSSHRDALVTETPPRSQEAEVSAELVQEINAIQPGWPVDGEGPADLPSRTDADPLDKSDIPPSAEPARIGGHPHDIPDPVEPTLETRQEHEASAAPEVLHLALAVVDSFQSSPEITRDAQRFVTKCYEEYRQQEEAALRERRSTALVNELGMTAEEAEQAGREYMGSAEMRHAIDAAAARRAATLVSDMAHYADRVQVSLPGTLADLYLAEANTANARNLQHAFALIHRVESSPDITRDAKRFVMSCYEEYRQKQQAAFQTQRRTALADLPPEEAEQQAREFVGRADIRAAIDSAAATATRQLIHNIQGKWTKTSRPLPDILARLHRAGATPASARKLAKSMTADTGDAWAPDDQIGRNDSPGGLIGNRPFEDSPDERAFAGPEFEELVLAGLESGIAERFPVEDARGVRVEELTFDNGVRVFKETYADPMDALVQVLQTKVAIIMGAPVAHAMLNIEDDRVYRELTPGRPGDSVEVVDPEVLASDSALRLGLFDAVTGTHRTAREWSMADNEVMAGRSGSDVDASHTGVFASSFVRRIDGRPVWLDHAMPTWEVAAIREQVSHLDTWISNFPMPEKHRAALLDIHGAYMAALTQVERHAVHTFGERAHRAGLDAQAQAKARLVEVFALDYPHVAVVGFDHPDVPADVVAEILGGLDEMFTRFPGRTNIRELRIDYTDWEANSPRTHNYADPAAAGRTLSMRFSLRDAANPAQTVKRGIRFLEFGLNPVGDRPFHHNAVHEFVHAIDAVEGLSKNLQRMLSQTWGQLSDDGLIEESWWTWLTRLPRYAFVNEAKTVLDDVEALAVGFAEADIHSAAAGSPQWAIHEYVTTGRPPRVTADLEVDLPPHEDHPDSGGPGGLIGSRPHEPDAQLDAARGAWIKALRLERGMTQKQLAQAVGLTNSALSMIESGKSTPRLGNFQQLCRALGLDGEAVTEAIRRFYRDVDVETAVAAHDSLGGWVAALRNSKGMTRADLARAVDIVPTSVTEIENGVYPLPGLFLRIARVLGVGQQALAEAVREFYRDIEFALDPDAHDAELPGSWIAALRYDRDMSQAELARTAGIPKQSVGRIERGHTPNWIVFLQICRALEVAPEVLAAAVRHFYRGVNPDLDPAAHDPALPGSWFMALRHDQGMSGSEVANAIGYGSDLSDIESGRNRPEFALFRQICDVLGVGDELLRAATRHFYPELDINPPPHTLLGGWIKELRLERGMTQKELARRARMSQPYISAVELGTRFPPVRRLRQLCGALGVGGDVLLEALEQFYADRYERSGAPEEVALFHRYVVSRVGSPDEKTIRDEICATVAWVPDALARRESPDIRDEAVQAAWMGILSAIDSHVPSASFAAHAWGGGKRAILRYRLARAFPDLDNPTLKKVSTVRAQIDRMIAAGEPYDDAAIARAVNYTVADVVLAREILARPAVQLNMPTGGTDGSLPRDLADPAAAAEFSDTDFAVTVRATLADMADPGVAERLVMLHLVEGVPLADAAERLRISVADAAKVLADAVARLRDGFNHSPSAEVPAGEAHPALSTPWAVSTTESGRSTRGNDTEPDEDDDQRATGESGGPSDLIGSRPHEDDSHSDAARGAWIKALRLERGMTRKQLTEAAGLANSALPAIESGQRKPRVGSFQRICRALGLDDDAVNDAVRQFYSDVPLDTGVAAHRLPGDWVRAVRNSKGMTQSVLAHAVGVDPVRIGVYENNRESLRPGLFLRIARVLGVEQQVLAEAVREFYRDIEFDLDPAAHDPGLPGSWIAALRYDQDISRAELDRIAGIPETSVSRIEGGHTPNSFVFLRICRALGVAPEVLAAAARHFYRELNLDLDPAAHDPASPGSWFVALRHDRDISQSEVAKAIGSGKGHLYRIESGRNRPTFAVFRRICDVLGVGDELLRAAARHFYSDINLDIEPAAHDPGSPGSWIAALRNDAGMSGGELARRARMPRDSISQIENQRFRPRLRKFRQLCAALGVGGDVLLEAVERFYDRDRFVPSGDRYEVDLFNRYVVSRVGSPEEREVRDEICKRFIWVRNALALRESPDTRDEAGEAAWMGILSAIDDHVPAAPFAPHAWASGNRAIRRYHHKHQFAELNDRTLRKVIAVRAQIDRMVAAGAAPDNTEIARATRLKMADVMLARTILTRPTVHRVDDPAAAIGPSDTDFATAVRAALADMADPDAAERLVMLHLVEGVPLAEVAQRVALPVATAGAVFADAVARLRDAFDPGRSGEVAASERGPATLTPGTEAGAEQDQLPVQSADPESGEGSPNPGGLIGNRPVGGDERGFVGSRPFEGSPGERAFAGPGFEESVLAGLDSGIAERFLVEDALGLRVEEITFCNGLRVFAETYSDPLKADIQVLQAKLAAVMGAPVAHAMLNLEDDRVYRELTPHGRPGHSFDVLSPEILDSSSAVLLGLFDAVTRTNRTGREWSMGPHDDVMGGRARSDVDATPTGVFAAKFVKRVDGREVWLDNTVPRWAVEDIRERVTYLESWIESYPAPEKHRDVLLDMHRGYLAALAQIERHAVPTPWEMLHRAGLDDEWRSDDVAAKARLVEVFNLKYPYLTMVGFDHPQVRAHVVEEILGGLDEMFTRFPGRTNIRELRIDYLGDTKASARTSWHVDRVAAAGRTERIHFSLHHAARPAPFVEFGIRSRADGINPIGDRPFHHDAVHEFIHAIDAKEGLSENLRKVLGQTYSQLSRLGLVDEHWWTWIARLPQYAFGNEAKTVLNDEEALAVGFAEADIHGVAVGSPQWAIHEYVTTGRPPRVTPDLEVDLPLQDDPPAPGRARGLIGSRPHEDDSKSDAPAGVAAGEQEPVSLTPWTTRAEPDQPPARSSDSEPGQGIPKPSGGIGSKPHDQDEPARRPVSGQTTPWSRGDKPHSDGQLRKQPSHLIPERPADNTPDLVPLTACETEVLARVRQDMTHNEIAAALDLSVRDVRAHLASVRRKLRNQRVAPSRSAVLPSTKSESERFRAAMYAALTSADQPDPRELLAAASQEQMEHAVQGLSSEQRAALSRLRAGANTPMIRGMALIAARRWVIALAAQHDRSHTVLATALAAASPADLQTALDQLTSAERQLLVNRFGPETSPGPFEPDDSVRALRAVDIVRHVAERIATSAGMSAVDEYGFDQSGVPHANSTAAQTYTADECLDAVLGWMDRQNPPASAERSRGRRRGSSSVTADRSHSRSPQDGLPADEPGAGGTTAPSGAHPATVSSEEPGRPDNNGTGSVHADANNHWRSLPVDHGFDDEQRRLADEALRAGGFDDADTLQRPGDHLFADAAERRATENGQWWDSLSDPDAPGGLSSTQRALIQVYPHQIGNADGLSAVIRDHANRLSIRRDLDAFIARRPVGVGMLDWIRTGLTAAERKQLGNLIHIRNHLRQLDRQAAEVVGSPPVHLLSYDSTAFHGKGKAVVALGNVDTAQTVNWHVPGTNTTSSSLAYQFKPLRNLYEETLRVDPSLELASIIWIGYDAPTGPVNTGFAKAALRDRARVGGHRLLCDIAAFHATRRLAGTATPDRLAIRLYGHSYGSVTTCYAGRYGRLAGMVASIILAGSPGAGPVRHAEEFGIGAENIYVLASWRDPVTIFGADRPGARSRVNPRLGHGIDPATEAFGGQRIGAEFPASPNFAGAEAVHQGYLHRDPATGLPTEALANVAQITAGRGDALVRVERRRSGRGLGVRPIDRERGRYADGGNREAERGVGEHWGPAATSADAEPHAAPARPAPTAGPRIAVQLGADGLVDSGSACTDALVLGVNAIGVRVGRGAEDVAGLDAVCRSAAFEDATLAVEVNAGPRWSDKEVRTKVAEVVATLAGHGVQGEMHAFDQRVLTAAAELAPECHRVLLINSLMTTTAGIRGTLGWMARAVRPRAESIDTLLEKARRRGATGVAVPYPLLSEDFVWLTHEWGMRLAVRGVGGSGRMRAVIGLGVDEIWTANVEKLALLRAEVARGGFRIPEPSTGSTRPPKATPWSQHPDRPSPDR